METVGELHKLNHFSLVNSLVNCWNLKLDNNYYSFLDCLSF